MLERDWQREFSRLLDAHGAMLMSMLRRLTCNSHDAEDLFQETAARVWRSLPTRPWLSNPRAWLMTIGYRVFVDWRKRQEDRPSPLLETADARVIDPVHGAVACESTERLRRAVSALPREVREVVVLHYMSGLSLRQTGRAMEIPLGTVHSRLNSALIQLRSILQ